MILVCPPSHYRISGLAEMDTAVGPFIRWVLGIELKLPDL